MDENKIMESIVDALAKQNGFKDYTIEKDEDFGSVFITDTNSEFRISVTKTWAA